MTRKVKQVIEELEDDGWEHLRTKGDHRVYGKNGKIVVVPGKLSADVPEGTYSSIKRMMKQ